MIARLVLALAALAFATPALAQAGGPGVRALMEAHREVVAYHVTRHGRVVEASGEDLPIHPIGLVHELQPWASVTKQVMAVLVMQQAAAGRLALDAPVDRYWKGLSGGARMPTVRELLQHRSGLWNPDDSKAGTDGTPEWYRRHDDPLAACTIGRAAPGGKWRYNNCDYLVLGRVLEKVTAKSLDRLFVDGIARPAGLAATHFAGRRARARVATAETWDSADNSLFARFGPAGGLVGTVNDLYLFDRALLDGKLLPADAREKLWQGDPALGFMALGQWTFTAPLKGCAAPVRIVERRGGIGRYQIRNIILPEQDLTAIVVVRDADFDFGEIWQGKGFSHDLLAAAVCA